MIPLDSVYFPESHLQIYRNLAQSIGLRLEQEVDLNPNRFKTMSDGSRVHDGHLLRELLLFTERVSPAGISPSLNMLRHLEYTAHGWLGMAVTAAPNMQNALDIYLKYQSLIMPAVYTEARIGIDNLLLIFTPRIDLGHLTPILMENVMGCMGLMRSYMEKPMDIRKISFRHNILGDERWYTEFSDCRYLFNQADYRIVISKDVLDNQIITRNISLSHQLILEVDKRHRELPGSFGTEVMRRITQEAEKGIFLKQEQMAFEFHMSVRTMTRKLKKESLSYQQMIKEVKMLSAKQLLLQNPLLNVTQVAHRVGFSSAAAFVRAFKQLYGYTPLDFRASQVSRYS